MGHRRRSEATTRRRFTRLRGPVQPGDEKTFPCAHRLYFCARCGELVILCRSCDHGNRYCLDGCAQIRREESIRRARHRYRHTERGRLLHKRDQQLHLIRKAAKVRDQGSPAPRVEGKEPPAEAAIPVAGLERSDETPDRDPVLYQNSIRAFIQ